MSKELPIIFNTEMVKAILDGRKICTRRPIKNIPSDYEWAGWVVESTDRKQEGKAGFKPKGSNKYVYTGGKYQRPPYKVGDLIYVRETFRIPNYILGFDDGYGNFDNGYATVKYIADGNTKDICLDDDWEKQEAQAEKFSENNKIGDQPSIFMPKWASRINLKVIGIRVERVQQITEEESIKEGVVSTHRHSSRFLFARLWDSLYSNFNDNPWIWVIDFEVIPK